MHWTRRLTSWLRHRRAEEEQALASPASRLQSYGIADPSVRGKLRSDASSHSEPSKTDRLLPQSVRNFVFSRHFEIALVAIILANTLLVGFEIDSPELLLDWQWRILDIAFNTIYSLELSLKLWVHGFNLFSQPLEIFGAGLTLLAWWEISARLLNYAPWEATQILRALRVVQLGIVFPTLRVLLFAFVRSLRAIAWVVILGLFAFYVTACCAVLFIGRGDFHDEESRSIQGNFQSVWHSMYVFFELMTFETWPDYVRPLLAHHWTYVPFLVGFIFISNIFFLNVFTAIVVENVLAAQSTEKANDRNEEERLDALQVGSMCRVFFRENSGRDMISTKTIAEIVSRGDDEVNRTLQHLQWSPQYFQSLVSFCDLDNSGTVSIRNLQTLLQDCRTHLSMKNYLHFDKQLHDRVDYVDRLCQVTLEAVKQWRPGRAGRRKL
mmetsp:Transcript_36620/g.80233  ORF Transcript_36620/g.80233 Transcript_36620/m.80233 type:complete len:438 (+) Transcript_36620:125-1438(+)